LTSDNSQLKTKWESIQESYNLLAVDKPSVSLTYENDKNKRIQLETENAQLTERWNALQKELEKEKGDNVSFAKEVQELKKQAKALESTTNTFEELSSNVQLLEITLNEEQAKRNDIETKLKTLHHRYNDLYSTYFKQYQLLEATLSSLKVKMSSFPQEVVQ